MEIPTEDPVIIEKVHLRSSEKECWLRAIEKKKSLIENNTGL